MHTANHSFFSTWRFSDMGIYDEDDDMHAEGTLRDGC
jgi:hypothetical protein